VKHIVLVGSMGGTNPNHPLNSLGNGNILVSQSFSGTSKLLHFIAFLPCLCLYIYFISKQNSIFFHPVSFHLYRLIESI
jgi:hypothetical protein